MENQIISKENIYQSAEIVQQMKFKEQNELDSISIQPSTALRITALQNLIDFNDNKRQIGEKWIISGVEEYKLQPNEKLVEIAKGISIKDNHAIQLQAKFSFIDIYGNGHKEGEKYLVKKMQFNYHYLDSINETFIRYVPQIVLTKYQYCIIINPYNADSKQYMMGQKQIKQGPIGFYMEPEERLDDSGIQNCLLLKQNQAAELLVLDQFIDEDGIDRKPGEIYLKEIRSDQQQIWFVPPTQCKLLDKKQKLPLKQGETIIVLNKLTNYTLQKNIENPWISIKNDQIINEYQNQWVQEFENFLQKIRMEENQLILFETASNNRVLVTGAAGTVGEYIVQHLLAQGYYVIATDLPGTNILPSNTQNKFLNRIFGNITDLAFIFSIFQTFKFEYIIHVAAIIDISKTYEQVKSINVTSVKYLYQLAKNYNVQRFIFFSSGSIYKSRDNIATIKEQYSLEPESGYELSKYNAERYLREQHSLNINKNINCPDLIILRPSVQFNMIYGPRGKFLGAKFLLIPVVIYESLGFFPHFVGGGKTNWIHAEDMALAAIHMIKQEIPPHLKRIDTFNVSEEIPIGAGDLLTTIATSFGFKTRFQMDLPIKLLKFVSWFLIKFNFAYRIINCLFCFVWRRIIKKKNLQNQIPPSIDKEGLSYMARNVIFDVQKLKQTGFKWKHSIERDGYSEIINWYSHAQWVPYYKDLQCHYHQNINKSGILGFNFQEKMQGTCQLQENQDVKLQFNFNCKVYAPSIYQLFQDATTYLQGSVNLQNYASESVMEKGQLQFVVSKRPGLKYSFVFVPNLLDNQDYKFYFQGRKRYTLPWLLESLVTLKGKLYKVYTKKIEEQQQQSNYDIFGLCQLKFQLKDTPNLISSLRFNTGQQIPLENQDLKALKKHQRQLVKKQQQGSVYNKKLHFYDYLTSPIKSFNQILDNTYSSQFWYIWGQCKERKRGFLLDFIQRPYTVQVRLALFENNNYSKPIVISEFYDNETEFLRKVNEKTQLTDYIKIGNMFLHNQQFIGKFQHQDIQFSLSFDLNERNMVFSANWINSIQNVLPLLQSHYGTFQNQSYLKTSQGKIKLQNDQQMVYTHYKMPCNILNIIIFYVNKVNGIKFWHWLMISCMNFENSDLQLEMTAMELIPGSECWLATCYIKYKWREWKINDPLYSNFRSVKVSHGPFSIEEKDVKIYAQIKIPELTLNIVGKVAKNKLCLLQKEGNTNIYSSVIGDCEVQIQLEKESNEILKAFGNTLIELKLNNKIPIV